MRVFWDTNLFIYLLEANSEFSPSVLRIYDDLRSTGGRLLTSTLTLGELCTRPLKLGRADLAERYRALMTEGAVELLPFDSSAAIEYAFIRGSTGLKQPDAIQLACAIAGGATAFHTNDTQLLRVGSVKGLPILGLTRQGSDMA